jgi:Flp pilus assembly protein TadD
VLDSACVLALGDDRQRVAIVREADRASELDPLCLVVNTSAAWVRYAAGDYDWVINQCRLTIDMDVECRAAWRLLGAAYLQAGQHAEALQAFASALEHSPHDPVLIASYAVPGAVVDSAHDPMKVPPLA